MHVPSENFYGFKLEEDVPSSPPVKLLMLPFCKGNWTLSLVSICISRGTVQRMCPDHVRQGDLVILGFGFGVHPEYQSCAAVVTRVDASAQCFGCRESLVSLGPTTDTKNHLRQQEKTY